MEHLYESLTVGSTMLEFQRENPVKVHIRGNTYTEYFREKSFETG